MVYHRGSKPSTGGLPVIKRPGLGADELESGPLIGNGNDAGFASDQCLTDFADVDPPRVVVRGWPSSAVAPGSELSLRVHIAGSDDLSEVLLPLYYLPEVLEFLPEHFSRSSSTRETITTDLMDKGVVGILLTGRMPAGETICTLKFRVTEDSPPNFSQPITIGRHKGDRMSWIAMTRQGGGVVSTQGCSSMAWFEDETTHPELYLNSSPQ